jgi:hypothetical protein
MAGLGSLISGITSLFGGSSQTAPPPLNLFSLPNSIEESTYVASSAGRSYPGRANQDSNGNATSSAKYTSSVLEKNTQQSSTITPIDSTAIAQAVKNALLSSNTLADVILEL